MYDMSTLSRGTLSALTSTGSLIEEFPVVGLLDRVNPSTKVLSRARSQELLGSHKPGDN